MQAVKALSEPTCRALSNSGESCFSNGGVYLPGTVLQGCRMFKHCQNLPAGNCVTVMQTFKGGVRTYLLGTVLQWCRLIKRCQNLSAGHYVTVVQAV